MHEQPNQPDVLVTGGAGFIGSHLVRALVLRGRAVRVLELPGAVVSHLPLDRVEVVRADVRNRPAVEEAVRGCREVYHLAANPQLWAQPRGLYHQVNYRGAVNVLEAAIAAGVRRVLHTSTECILKRPAASAGLHFRHMVGPYCRSKFRAEHHAQRLALRGAPVVIVNPTLPIGPGDLGCSPPTRMLLDFCRGLRGEYLDATLNLIDVRDVAEGMIAAMAGGRPGRRYVLGNDTLSLRDIFAVLARLTGLPEPRRRVPYAVALAAAYVSEFVADAFTHRAPAATITGVRLTRRRLPFDPHDSLAELGLRARPAVESLADTVAWFVSMGWLEKFRWTG